MGWAGRDFWLREKLLGSVWLVVSKVFIFVVLSVVGCICSSCFWVLISKGIGLKREWFSRV